jgi:hypothetical protein
VNDEPVRFVAGQSGPELLDSPFGRVLRDVPMQDASCVDIEHQEHVDEPERGGDCHEEITRQGSRSHLLKARPAAKARETKYQSSYRPGTGTIWILNSLNI